MVCALAGDGATLLRFDSAAPGVNTTVGAVSGATRRVSTCNPNGGVLNTVGLLGFDTVEDVGYDTLTDAAGVNPAFASLYVGGVQDF